MPKFAVIIPAAGHSTRMQGIEKLNIMIEGKSVLQHSIGAFEGFDQVIVVGPEGDVPGGERRQDSVLNGLRALNDDIDFVLIHDAARPYVSQAVIERVKTKLLSGSAAVVPAVRPKDTIRTKSVSLDRNKLYSVQTPQGFSVKLLKSCFDKASEDGFEATDDAGIVEHCGFSVDIVEGDYRNIKITTRDDLPERVRYGQGYDLHVLEAGRKLMLGCVEIPFDKGLQGHSDADVLAHAICDALLGAAALGDIGRIFPDNDPKWEGVSGTVLLENVRRILNGSGFSISSVDATLIAQRPKIAPYADKMRFAIAQALGIGVADVSVKATTEEGSGSTGDGSCMAALATAVIKEKI